MYSSTIRYFPTDCPHRKKNGWTGDALLSAAQMNYNFEIERSAREWLHNVRAAQLPSGKLSGIVPTSGWGYDNLNGSAWAGVIIVLPYECYRFSRNKNILEENFSVMCSYLKYNELKSAFRRIFLQNASQRVCSVRCQDSREIMILGSIEN